jgi:hypothetical protein
VYLKHCALVRSTTSGLAPLRLASARAVESLPRKELAPFAYGQDGLAALFSG